MTDWNEEAKRLLPCIHAIGGFADCIRGVSYMCSACCARPAVADALAKAEARGAEERRIIVAPKDDVEQLRYDTATKLLGKLDELQAEIAKLKADNDRLKVNALGLASSKVNLQSKNAELEAELAQLRAELVFANREIDKRKGPDLCRG